MNNLTGLGRLFCLTVCLLPISFLYAQFDDDDEGPNHAVYYLTAQRGTYLLDFDKIYETVASLDHETVVTLPKGYAFSLARSGSIDFINVFVIQNELRFTRTIDHAINTSITCNVITPEGESKTLIFKIKGGPAFRDSIVYGIHFTVPKKQDVQETPLAELCAESVNFAVAKKEQEMNEDVHRSTMVEAVPAFFSVHRKQAKVEHKGAAAFINGIIFSRSEAYIYILSNVRRDQCDVVKLLGIKQGRNELTADFVDLFENLDGTWSYVYRAPLQQPKKRSKIQFIFEIWSKKLTYNIVMS